MGNILVIMYPIVLNLWWLYNNESMNFVEISHFLFSKIDC